MEKRERGSLFTGILLILFGALFLAGRIYPGLEIGHLLVRYWPLLLIIWGVTLLIERTAARRAGDQPRAALGGGEVILILGLLVVAGCFVAWDAVRHHSSDWNVVGVNTDWMRESATASEELSSLAIQPGGQVRIQLPNGDITVHAGSTDKVRVMEKRTAYAWDEHEAERKVQQVSLSADSVSGGIDIRPKQWGTGDKDARIDLDVEVPEKASVSAQTNSGDVGISGVTGDVDANTSNGDTDIHDITGNVNVNSRHGDIHVASTKGDVKLTGTGGEVEFADVSGNVSIQGEFLGPIRARNVGKAVQFNSSRTSLTVTGLNGHLETDTSTMEIADAAGPLKLNTRDKDVTLEDIRAAIELNSQHGDVEVTMSQPPHEPITLSSDSGDISLTLPSKSTFTMNATARSGEIDSDFEGPSLNAQKNDETSTLTGTYGTGSGAQIKIDTSYGTISLHRGP